MGRIDKHRNWRVLAIDPTTKGFGFAVLEGEDVLLDWGVRRISHENEFVLKVGMLCDWFKPDIVVLEREFDSQRGERAQGRIIGAAEEATRRQIATCKVSRKQVCAVLGANSKRAISSSIKERFPELRRLKDRPIGDPEREHFAIFDAISFALTVLLRL